jgi:hypothetical protein
MMDKNKAKQLSDALKIVVERVAADHGLIAELHGGIFDPVAGTYQPRIILKDPGAVAAQFRLYAAGFGLVGDELGRQFMDGSYAFTITGLSPNKRTRPVQATRSDGRIYNYPVYIVKARLGVTAMGR